MQLSYETWSEVYGIEADTRWKVLAEESISCIHDELSFRNPDKYGKFLKNLKRTRFVLKIMNVPQYEKRIELLKYMYYALRLFDDICDGDTLAKLSLDERKQIIHKNRTNWLYDILIAKARSIAEEIWVIDWINYAIAEIEGSIKFDIDRIIDSNKFRTREDLERNFHRMDIEWTEFWTAIIFGLDPESVVSIEKLWRLWTASRKSMNIEDLQDDIVEWLINVPIEELQQFGITQDDLDQVKKWEITENIRKWIEREVDQIRLLLSEYNNTFSLWNILKWNWVKVSFSTNYLREIFNNMVLKYVVLPKWYIWDINRVVKQYS